MKSLEPGAGKVICRECGKSIKFINSAHLKTHNMTVKEYKEKYPDADVTSQSFRVMQSNRWNKKDVFEEKIVERLVEEVRIEKQDEIELDKIPKVSEQDIVNASNFIDDIKKVTKECLQTYPNPKNLINKNKLKILNFLIKWYSDVKDSYFVEYKNPQGKIQARYVTDIAIPFLKIDLEFPDVFWHNYDIPKNARDQKLKEMGWKVITFKGNNPSVEEISDALKKIN